MKTKAKRATCPTNSQTRTVADSIVCPVQLALETAHDAAARLGRCLHPHETRWMVRSAFRLKYRGIAPALANEFADTTIARIHELTS